MSGQLVPQVGEVWRRRFMREGFCEVTVLLVTETDVMYRFGRSGNEWALEFHEFVRRYEFASAPTIDSGTGKGVGPISPGSPGGSRAEAVAQSVDGEPAVVLPLTEAVSA